MSDETESFVVEVNRFKFDSGGIEDAERHLFGKLMWPLVYILSDKKNAYVGESTNVGSRMRAHLSNTEKGPLKDVRLITSPQFNKSAALHFEAKLISYLSGEGKLNLINRNDGLTRHEYYQQEDYDKLFEELWLRLRDENLVEKSLKEIDNSDLFKFSPYKALSTDQYEAVAKVISSLADDADNTIMIRGAAGTGKTILAIFLLKLLSTSLNELIPTDEDREGEQDLDIKLLTALKTKYPSPRIGLVIAMKSLRITLKDVFKTIYGLSPNQVMGPSEIARSEERFDIIFVDEAHRLRQRKALSNYGYFDDNNESLGLSKKGGTELDWILLRAKKVVFFYDKSQSVKPSDIDQSRFDQLQNTSLVIDLQTQHRSKGGVEFTTFVKDILNDTWKDRKEFDANKDFELLFFDDFSAMVTQIKKRDKKHGLGRLIAGFAWDWKSKKDKSAIDIVIEDIELQWNMTGENWINSPTAVNEVGCIHTTQGYDLNYAGVIFGPEIGYDPIAKRIVVYKKNYKDKKGKEGTNEETLANYIKQIYYTVLCRGMKGTFIYVCDDNLREHLKGFFKHYKPTEKEHISLGAKIIQLNQAKPYIDSIPYYDIAVAAGDFSETQVDEHPEWLRLEDGSRISNDYFACKVVGESMNKRIPSGSICLFSKNTAGSNQGKIVLAAHSKFKDSDFGSGLTIKQYSSIKKVDGEFDWTHESVRLEPLSNDSSFEPIILTADEVGELRIVGEFVRVIG